MEKVKAKSRMKVFLAVAAAVLVLAVALALLLRPDTDAPAGAAATASVYTEQTVEKRSISSSVTGSGALEAANSYSVSTIIEGTILTDTFEEGDIVEKDTVLYTLDSSDVATSLEQAEISFNQTKRNYERKVENLEKLKVKTKKPGRVISLHVEVGDEVSVGQTLAVVQEIDYMLLDVPFPSDDAASFTVGQAATVTLDSTFETLNGTVEKISALDTVLTGNRIVRTVTIKVSNPGGLSVQQTASAAVGGVESTAGASFRYENQWEVKAEVSGEVVKLNVAEGDRVTANQVVVTLESEALRDEIQAAADSLRNAEISLDNRYYQLENYTITSPISGTVIDKYYKAGETSEANQVMCTIYDLSYLTMTLDVDELDISKIQAGQTVSVSADAVDGKIYEGIVTKVSVAGTYSSGVTTYPVTIRLDETEGLLPGMNVDATIMLESATDVLTIPTGALQRGNSVMLTAESPSAANGEPTQITDANGKPYVSVKIVTGVADEDYVEVISGLQEGDTVVYIETSSGGNSMFGGMPMGMGGMPSGMGMGGMGGMGGSRPSGNMGGMSGGNRSGMSGGNRQGGYR